MTGFTATDLPIPSRGVTHQVCDPGYLQRTLTGVDAHECDSVASPRVPVRCAGLDLRRLLEATRALRWHPQPALAWVSTLLPPPRAVAPLPGNSPCLVTLPAHRGERGGKQTAPFPAASSCRARPLAYGPSRGPSPQWGTRRIDDAAPNAIGFNAARGLRQQSF